MLLSQLIFYKESLEQFDCSVTKKQVAENFNEVIDAVNRSPVKFDEYNGLLESDLISIQSQINKFQSDLETFKRSIDREISNRSQEYFSTSYKNYSEIVNEPLDNILNRELRMSPDDESLLKHRLRNYSNWVHPGGIIRPEKSQLFKEMVDCDPFYLIDIDHSLLQPSIDSINPVYAGRTRKIVFNDRDDFKISKLPRNQLGFLFAWNFLNYKPLEIVKQYLEELFNVLKPGGVFLFTFNDCDRSLPVKLVENAFASFTPGHLLETMAQSIGYEVIYKHQGSYHCNWLEIRRPGQLTSLKGGQSLAKIIAKPTENSYNNLGLESIESQKIRAAAKKLKIPGWDKDSVQILEPKVEEEELKKDASTLNIPNYETMTSKELRRAIKKHHDTQELRTLRQIAIDQGLDTPTNIRYGYSLEKLRIVTKDWRKEE